MMMNDTHIYIEMLERYALKSPVLSSVQMDTIATHIIECEDCAEHLRQIISFYTEIEEVNENALSPEAIRILERSKDAAEARIIELFPKRASSIPQQERPSMIALAAQDKDLLNHYVPAGTLLSNDGNTILRLTRDNELQQYLLQIHADEPDCYAHVLVSFDCIQGVYLTNEAGEAVIPQKKKVSFRDAHASIRIPRDVFQLQEECVESVVPGMRGYMLHILPVDGQSQYSVRISDSHQEPVETELKLAFFVGTAVKIHTFAQGFMNVDASEMKAANIAALF